MYLQRPTDAQHLDITRDVTELDEANGMTKALVKDGQIALRA